jgi:hypothetical protein
VRDALDVADLQSESDHACELRLAAIGLQPASLLTMESYPDGKVVVDGGRGVPGAEEFTVADLSAGRPLEIVMRTTAAPFTLRVSAGGGYVGEWNFAPSATR